MMKSQYLVAVSLTLAAILSAGCRGSEKGAGGDATKATLAPAGSIPPVAKRIEGTVLQVLKAGRYIYLELSTGTESVWVAAVDQPVEKGDRVACDSETVMEGFESPSLKRKFDRVYFVARLVNQRTMGAMPTNHPPVQAMPPGHGLKKSVAAADIKVDVPPAEGGLTVAGLISGAKDLAGKEVVLRAKVTKYNANIMDANWLHVRDGSDKRDVVVTTKSEARVGDTVLVRGRPELDVDLGHGYRYDLILRNASVTVEDLPKP